MQENYDMQKIMKLSERMLNKMETDLVFSGRKINIIKTVIRPQIGYRFNVVPIKTSTELSMEVSELIVELINT